MRPQRSRTWQLRAVALGAAGAVGAFAVAPTLAGDDDGESDDDESDDD